MAAPQGMSIGTLNGAFVLNKDISDSMDPIFIIQGIPYPVRKITQIATIRLEKVVKPLNPSTKSATTVTTNPPHEEQQSSPTPGDPEHPSPPLQLTMTFIMSQLGPFGMGPLRAVGLAADRVETRTLDGSEYTTSEPVVGPSRGRWWITTPEGVAQDAELDAFHREGAWAAGSQVLRMSIRSTREKGAVWAAEHAWGFEDVGGAGAGGTGPDVRYVARMKAFRDVKGKREEAHARLVYDFVGAAGEIG
ncbi:hypothetical protein F4775DRAFT_591362 [Biscogniauxia sp. FL1348]|nr:hypothetical protein F4775DRAFT_591362 [Biscogniauxia sp. FL1348]